MYKKQQRKSLALATKLRNTKQKREGESETGITGANSEVSLLKQLVHVARALH